MFCKQYDIINDSWSISFFCTFEEFHQGPFLIALVKNKEELSIAGLNKDWPVST